jgi:signal transduction histidine kinase
MKLLIVDDHAINLKLLRAQLEAEGHEIEEAHNGVEAMERLKEQRFDAVISDILMPQMDGFRLCLEIRKTDAIAGMPFILYTSTYSSPEDRQLAQIVGADRYVVKPAPARAIFDALREAAHAREAARPLMPAVGADEGYVLKQYNEALVAKLEEKNAELQGTLQRLQEAHDEILALNRTLEQRVEQRTSDLAAANRELESFSYSVSHDLRAPLRAIGGFARILGSDHGMRLGADASGLVDRIVDNVGRMNQLIDDLLEFSRLGRKALSIQPVDLGHLMRECMEQLRDEIEGRDVEIDVGPLPTCMGDIILLKQVALNLLGNALKYTKRQAHARIEVSAQTEGSEYVFRIADNGVGFDMRYADKLFEVFQRLHSASEFGGTGVGLAIVRRAIERHGGRCWAESEPECGAVFYFALPLDPCA